MTHLVIWNDLRLFLGQNPRSTKEHSHPVIQFVVALEGTFQTKIPDQNVWVPKRGLLIRPNHQHVCDATDVPILSLEIEPDSALGEWILATILKEHHTIDYPSPEIGALGLSLLPEWVARENWEAVYQHLQEVFRMEKPNPTSTRDERISQVVEYIHEHIEQALSTDQLTRVSFLSESRLLHLFKEEMGLPIRNYILWYRLKMAMGQFMEGASLTEAAHRAGFADQAHFTRTCVRMLGVPPSVILKNSKFVQVSFSA